MLSSRFFTAFAGFALQRIVVVFALLAAIVVTGAVVAGAIVPQTPRLDTPIVLDGEVWAIEQVGNAVVVGGNFTQIQTERDGPTIEQAGLFAYDLDSGILLEDFLPTLGSNDGFVEIKALQPAADGRSVYFAGKFTTVDDHTDETVRVRNRVAKIDVSTGRLDRSFALGGVDAKVLTLDLLGDHLYIGGNFSVVYDTDVGRSPIEHDHHSLVRFDSTTGAYDPTFWFEPETSLATTTGLLGVTNINHTPDGLWMVLTHRGQFIETLDGVLHHRPGIAMLSVNNGIGTATLGNFAALYPDPEDANQDFYHTTSCGGGIRIRDMEISPDGEYFAVTHQGADAGMACDTTVRWPIVDAPTRPDWVSRVFDSVFSLGIDDDAIYIGGHFRYMVSPTAPSSYPGETVTNGGKTGDIYTADVSDSDFVEDLIEPGYVYVADQIGAITPETGLGIPTWNPGSDADKGVLVITMIDRGMLIGQDNGRINDFNTGRAAFLDETPDAGQPQCLVALDDDRNPVVTWTDIGDVSEWQVARNDTFVGSSTSTSFTDLDAPVETDLTYELRFNRNGIAQTDDCGSVRIDLIPITCVVQVTGDASLDLLWNDTDADTYAIRRNGVFIDTVRAGEGEIFQDTDLVPDTEYEYEVRAQRDGITAQSTTCSGTTLGRLVTCTVSAEGYDVTTNFNGTEFTRVSIFRDGTWVATVSGEDSYTEALLPGNYSYTVRGVINGFTSEAACGDVAVVVQDLLCQATVNDTTISVAFNGTEYDRVSIFRDGAWLTTVSDVNEFTETVETGTYSYTARGVLAGNTTPDADCGSVTVDPPAFSCRSRNRATHQYITWNNIGVAEYQIRRDGAWVSTQPDTASSWRDFDATSANEHQIRYNVNGVTYTVDCT